MIFHCLFWLLLIDLLDDTVLGVVPGLGFAMVEILNYQLALFLCKTWLEEKTVTDRESLVNLDPNSGVLSTDLTV